MSQHISLSVLEDTEKGKKSPLHNIIKVLQQWCDNHAETVKRMVIMPSLHVRSIYAPNGYTLSMAPNAPFDPCLFFTHMYGGIAIKHVPEMTLTHEDRHTLLMQMDGWFPFSTPNQLYCHATELSFDIMDREIKRYRETLGSSKTFVGLFSTEVTNQYNISKKEYYIVCNTVPPLSLADEIDGLHIDLNGKPMEEVAAHPRVLKIRAELRRNRDRILGNMMALLGLHGDTVTDTMSDYLPKRLSQKDEVSKSKFEEAARVYLRHSKTNCVHIAFEFSNKASVKQELRGYPFGFNLYILKTKFQHNPQMHNQVPSLSALLAKLVLVDKPLSAQSFIDLEYNYIETRNKQVIFYNDTISTYDHQGIGVFIQSPLRGLSLVVDYQADATLVGQSNGNRCLNSLPIEYPRLRSAYPGDSGNHSHVASTFTTDHDNPFNSTFFTSKHGKWSARASEAFGIAGHGFTKKLLHLKPEVVRLSMDE